MNQADKEQIIYIFDLDKLERGDIILTTSKNKVSNIIRLITLGPFSHALLYLGDGSYAEAGGPGIRVNSNNIQRLFIDSPKQCAILRLKVPLSEPEMDEVINHARSNIGMEYSLDEAKLVAWRVKYSAKEINRQFCSRYVAQAYQKEGVMIVKNPDYCSPTHIFNSTKLKKVDNILRVATKEEIEKFSEASVPLNMQDYADEYLFSNAKRISGYDIQNHGHFNAVVIKFPNLDDNFAELLNDSGYLTLWELEKNEHPYFYDFVLLSKKFPDNTFLKEFGKKRLIAEIEIRKRFDITLRTLSDSYKYNKLQTLKLQIDLYNALIALSNARSVTFLLASRL